VGEGPEVKLLLLQKDDTILMCTDGIHGVVADEGILSCLREHRAVQQCADRLCQMALDAGSRRNVSCMVFQKDP
jgi:serine/threonine protein phosphatase PrpC